MIKIFNISDGYKLLNECYTCYPELKDRGIKVEVSNKGFMIDLTNDIIYIENRITNKNQIKLFIRYLKDEFNFNLDKNKIEKFAFLHEVGHSYHNYDYALGEYRMTDIMRYNEEFYSNTKSENFINYRQMECEYLADTFAIDMMNNLYN